MIPARTHRRNTAAARHIAHPQHESAGYLRAAIKAGNHGHRSTTVFHLVSTVDSRDVSVIKETDALSRLMRYYECDDRAGFQHCQGFVARVPIGLISLEKVGRVISEFRRGY